MDKADNQDKKKEDEEREALAYLDRPSIYTGTATIPKPPPWVMVWLRSILGRRAKF